jgi:hypothetical protein
VKEKGKEAFKVYVSYHREVEKKNGLVGRLAKASLERGIELIIDENRIEYRQSIREYMEDLGQGHCVILILSDEYLKSEYCMFELLEIKAHENIRKRVFPVVLDSVAIDNVDDLADYLLFWEKKKKNLEAKLSKIGREYTEEINKKLDLYADIRREFTNIISILSDMRDLTNQEHLESNFTTLLDQIDNIVKKRTSKEHGYEELLNETERFQQQKIFFYSGSVKEMVRTSLARLLSKELLKPYVDILVEIIQRELPDKDPQKFDEVVDALLQMNVENSFRMHDMATKQCLDDFSNTGRKFGPIWAECKKIMGWLLLTMVDEKWLKSFMLNLYEKRPAVFKLPVSTHPGVEIVISRIDGKPAALEIRSNKDHLRIEGYGGISCSHLPDKGWDQGENLMEIKRLLWAKLMLNRNLPDPPPFDINLQLNEKLAYRRKKGERRYLVVDVSGMVGNLVVLERVLGVLRHELPDLTQVIFADNSLSSAFVIPERKLSLLLDDFFQYESIM